MKFKFTPRTVVQIEDETKQSITGVLGDLSMRNIITVVKHGLSLSGDEGRKKVEDKIEKYFKESGDNDLMTLYLDIIEQLRDSGFLPKSLKLDKIRDKMKNLQIDQV